MMQYTTELHRRGNLAEAERGYRQILAIALLTKLRFAVSISCGPAQSATAITGKHGA